MSLARWVTHGGRSEWLVGRDGRYYLGNERTEPIASSLEEAERWLRVRGLVPAHEDTNWQRNLVRMWNEEYEVGCRVLVTEDDGRKTKTTTRSHASLLGGHTAAVLLADRAGLYSLERVEAMEDEE